ncbi:hypothetical protein BDZ89DRAFT_1202862, partial [Hymenopellis radicata]
MLGEGRCHEERVIIVRKEGHHAGRERRLLSCLEVVAMRRGSSSCGKRVVMREESLRRAWRRLLSCLEVVAMRRGSSSCRKRVVIVLGEGRRHAERGFSSCLEVVSMRGEGGRRLLWTGSSNVVVCVLECRGLGPRASQSKSRAWQSKSSSVVVQVLKRRSAGPRVSWSQVSWFRSSNIVKLPTVRSGDVKEESRLTTHLRVLEWTTTSGKTTCTNGGRPPTTRRRAQGSVTEDDVRKAASHGVAHPSGM